MENLLKCLDCGQTLKGRSDKKFCNVSCRNHFNNRINAEQSQLMREVNTSLRRNRKILLDLIEAGKNTIQHSWLSRKGFDFELVTAIQKKRSNPPCYLCYDLGYIPIDENNYQVVRLKEN